MWQQTSYKMTIPNDYFTAPLRYIGTAKNKNPSIGDLCCECGRTLIFTGNTWEEIGTACDGQLHSAHKKIRYEKNVCEHCGAPLQTLLGEEVKCDYCGAVYS